MYSVLVVDDYEPWRRHVCGEIQKHARWQVDGEARDGLEAVRTAFELNPDLILLDVGLPGLNGLEAARRILAQRPAARILIVTEQQSPDIAEAALVAGARGYLFKMDAGRDLLFAMEAVINGGGFLSTALVPHFQHLTPVRDGARRHEVGFYSDEASILDAYVRFAESGLRAGHRVIVLACEPRRSNVLQRLEASGLPVESLIRERQCLPIDAEDLLSRITVDGSLDEERFRAAVIPCIAPDESSSAPTSRVVACGEVAPRLWKKGRPDAAVRLEHLWDGLVRDYNVETLCGYAGVDVPRLSDQDYAVFQRICHEHSAVHVR